MSLHNYIDRIKKIDEHIRAEATGNMEILAQKIGLSIPGAYKFVKEMRDIGIPVQYSKTKNRFYYAQEGKIFDHLFLEDTVSKNLASKKNQQR